MSVRRGAIVLFYWGLALGVATAVQLPFKTRLIMHAMLGTASILTMMTGVVVLWLDARRRQPDEPLLLAITETSFASALTAFGVVILLLGGGFGYWLALIGAGVLGFGVGGVIRETMARRKDLKVLAGKIGAFR